MVVLTIALGVTFLAVVVHGLLSGYREEDRFGRVVAEENEAVRVYDSANEKFIATANRDAERVAGTAWLRCSRSFTTATNRYAVAHRPTQASLDACEIQAVALAESRGYPKAEASKFIQAARDVSSVAYQDALKRAERADRASDSEASVDP